MIAPNKILRMDNRRARQIINTYRLTSREVGKKLLRLIQQDGPLNIQNLPSSISLAKISNIKNLYNDKVQELRKKGQEIIPRNLPFYLIIKEKHPLFFWKPYYTKQNKSTSCCFSIENNPRIENLRLSLFDLLMQDPVDVNPDTPLYRRYTNIKILPEAFLNHLNDLIQNLNIIYPDQATMELIVAWLHKGLNGEPLTIFSPVCPDYSFEQIGENLYRYTFSELRSGVGLVARRILDALPLIEAFSNENGLHINFVVGIGDYEALVEENVKRLNVSTQEFLTRVQTSIDTIQKVSPVMLKGCMITDLCGGHAPWIKLIQTFKSMFDKNIYGQSPLCKKNLLDIVKARKPLYDQWLGKRSSLEDYLPLLHQQGCEYSAVGKLVMQHYNNPLILGADHSGMAPFYHVEHPMPILYLKRVYQ